MGTSPGNYYKCINPLCLTLSHVSDVSEHISPSLGFQLSKVRLSRDSALTILCRGDLYLEKGLRA